MLPRDKSINSKVAHDPTAEMFSRPLRACLKTAHPSSRMMASLSFAEFGSPQKVLKLGSTVNTAELKDGLVRVAIKSSRVCAEDIRAITGRSPINACRGVAGTTGVGSVVESSFSGVAKSSIVFVVGSGTWNDFAMVRGENVFELVKLTADAAAQIDVVASACAILDQNALVAGETIYVDVADEALAAAIAAVAKSSSLKVAATGDKLDNVKLAITSAAGAPLTNIVRQIARNGTVVRVNAAAPSAEIGFTTGVSSFIFQDKRVRGFDLHALAEADPAACKRAVNAAAALLADKKVSLPAAKVFPQSEFAASIAAAESGKSAILTIS